ncbi:DNA damage-inducible protein DinB [Cytophagales bacterium WSM2-2]|nr:DNA damage-inducible protein DinB [Cytophagales bacterium WSM2-2]
MLLNLDTVPHFYKNYVKQIEEPDILQALRISGHRMQELVHSIPEKKADFAYAPGKWTVRELLCHMIDAERIFGYRALRFARNDKTPLPGFEENDYAPQANASGRPLKKIASDMVHLRSSTIDLFESFTPEMLTRKGLSNNNELSVMALGFIIPGHETHHRKILVERYLSDKA